LTDKEKKSAEEVKRALLAAFAVDSFVAYEQFVARRLGGDESPDVFLADLRRLVSLFGGVSDKALRGGSRLEELNLSQVLARARAVITDDRPGDAREAFLGAKEAKSSPRVAVSAQRCYACGVPNHFARNCTAQRLQSPKKEDTSGSRNRARNYDRWRRGGKCASKASLQGNRVWEEA
ncbi:zinc knuckle, partial [Trichuris suis]